MALRRGIRAWDGHSNLGHAAVHSRQINAGPWWQCVKIAKGPGLLALICLCWIARWRMAGRAEGGPRKKRQEFFDFFEFLPRASAATCVQAGYRRRQPRYITTRRQTSPLFKGRGIYCRSGKYCRLDVLVPCTLYAVHRPLCKHLKSRELQTMLESNTKCLVL